MDPISSIITATSTLAAVGLTLFFTNRRERSKFIQDMRLKDLHDEKQFFIDIIASIEDQVRQTRFGESGSGKSTDAAMITAKLSLFATNEIADAYTDVQNSLADWRAVYLKIAPKMIGERSFSIITTDTPKHRDQATIAYDNYFKMAIILVELLKKEMQNYKDKL